MGLVEIEQTRRRETFLGVAPSWVVFLIEQFERESNLFQFDATLASRIGATLDARIAQKYFT
jgi:hypothetical protein